MSRLTEEESLYIEQLNEIAKTNGYESLLRMGPVGILMVILEHNGLVTTKQHDSIRKYFER